VGLCGLIGLVAMAGDGVAGEGVLASMPEPCGGFAVVPLEVLGLVFGLGFCAVVPVAGVVTLGFVPCGLVVVVPGVGLVFGPVAGVAGPGGVAVTAGGEGGGAATGAGGCGATGGVTAGGAGGAGGLTAGLFGVGLLEGEGGLPGLVTFSGEPRSKSAANPPTTPTISAIMRASTQLRRHQFISLAL
jgi:hypothetical protein